MPEPKRKPKVFVASSSEALDYAVALKGLLAKDLEVAMWNDEDFFLPGGFTLEALEEKSREFDGAIVLATADDRLISRGTESASARDNVLLEFGLLTAVLGRKRVPLVVEKLDGLELPSDVLGLTTVPFTKDKNSPENGLRLAARKIKLLAATWRDAPFLGVAIAEKLKRVLQITLADIEDRASVSSDLGFHVFLVDDREDPAVLKRVARARPNPKQPRLWPPFPKGHGVVGWCWVAEESVLVDLTTEPFASASKDEWKLLPDSQRFGMPFEMLESSRRRYKCIGAIPITTIGEKARFVGCISYNLGKSAKASPTDLQSDSVERALDAAAEMVSIVIDA